MTDSITFQVLRADELSLAQRAQIIDLGAAAYDEPFDWLFDMLPDSTHLLGRQAHDLVCHAAWVTRWFEPEGRPMLRAAYIEAVATAPEYQGRGLATALMREVATLIGGYDLGGLSPFSVAFYERLGWERWRGPLAIRAEGELLPTPDETVMILRLPGTPQLDLGAGLTAEWRTSELW